LAGVHAGSTGRHGRNATPREVHRDKDRRGAARGLCCGTHNAAADKPEVAMMTHPNRNRSKRDGAVAAVVAAAFCVALLLVGFGLTAGTHGVSSMASATNASTAAARTASTVAVLHTPRAMRDDRSAAPAGQDGFAGALW
jgi:hypothetical protein